MRAFVWIVLIAIARPVAADVLKMRQVDSTNLHIANDEGAIHWSEDLAITVDLGAKSRVGVVSKGTRGEHNMYVVNNGTYNTDDTVTWLTTWRGTWKIAKDTLTLDLAVVKDTCTAVRDERGTKTPKTCTAASKLAVITCTAATVGVEIGAKLKKTAAWRCAPDDASSVGESPASWLLGKDRCIEVRGGRMMPMSFGPCS